MSTQEPLSPEREAQIREYLVGLMKSGASDRTVKESLTQLGIEPSSVLPLIRDAMIEARQEPVKSSTKHGDKLRSVKDRKKAARNQMLFGFFLASIGVVWNLISGYFLISVFFTGVRGGNLIVVPGYLLILIGSVIFFVGLYRYTTGVGVDEN
jgi:hypothetical protein